MGHLRFQRVPAATVFEEDAARFEVVPDLVGPREVALPPGLAPLADELLDLLGGHRRPLVLGPAQARGRRAL